MNSKQLDQQIRERISTFLEELSSLVRRSAVEAVREALSGGAAASAAPRRGPGRPRKAAAAAAAAPKAAKAAKAAKPAKRGRKAKARKAAKVSSAQVTELSAKLYDHVKSNPAQSIEEIGRALSIDTQLLKPAVKKLVADKVLKPSGKARGTRYSASK